MFYVEMYFRVRRACLVEGMSVREASRVFDLHRDTVRKMLDNATPQGYTRQSPPRQPKLEPYTGVIDAILEADSRVPRKQRHTAKRIFERRRDEYGFDGQHTIVKDYVREHRRRVAGDVRAVVPCTGPRPVRFRGGVGGRSPVWSARCTTSCWTCPTATAAS